MKTSQEKRILKYLKSGMSLTHLEAEKIFACMRLAARVNVLKGQGHNIKSTMVEVGNGKRVARYSL